jgi:hypothetical protein
MSIGTPGSRTPWRCAGAIVSTQIEAHVAAIAWYGFHAAEGIDNPRGCIGTVALSVESLIPVVEWSRTWLTLDPSGPRVLPRWLIEAAMDDELGHWSLP